MSEEMAFEYRHQADQ